MTRHHAIYTRLRERRESISPTAWHERSGATPSDCPRCGGHGLTWPGCHECGEVAIDPLSDLLAEECRQELAAAELDGGDW